MNLKTLHVVYEFMTTYVQRIYPDTAWKHKMEQSPNIVFFQMVTPSIITYVISLAKNEKSLWDQKKRWKSNPGMGGEKKERLLFTGGEGKKRTYGKTMWNMEGLDYFYTAEKNWKDVNNTRKQFLQWLMEGRGGSQMTRQRRICLGHGGETQMRRTAGRRVKVTTIKGWWEDEEDGYSLDKFFKDLDYDYDIDVDIAKRIYNKVLRDSLLEEEAKYYQEEELTEKEKKGRIMTMNRGYDGEENKISKVIDVPLSVMPDRPQQERRAGTKYKK